MTRRLPLRHRGSSLVVTLTTVAALSFMAAYTLIRSAPRVRMAYQNCAWQEARIAAEAGIDAAMNDLLLNATGFQPGKWTGWKEEKPPASTTAVPGTLLGSVIQTVENTTTTLSDSGVPGGSLLITTTNALNNLLGGVLSQGSTAGGTSTGGVTASAPLYLDNVRLTAITGIPTEMDIRLWALEPVANPSARWFRIRCMATCALPPGADDPPAALDGHLRRLSLRGIRPSLRRDDAGAPTTIPLPNVSRTVEVLVEPILSFELALWTNDSITLPYSGKWNVDSFDSTDPMKSGVNGAYPGRGAPQIQANGSIASGSPHTPDSPYGVTIAANGAIVRGAAATDGGDDPATKQPENISGAAGIDPDRIHDNFSRRMIPLVRPSGDFLPAPKSGVFVTGTKDAPTIYSVRGNLGDFQIAAPKTGTGAVVIMVDGSLETTKPLSIPPTVVAVLFVRGNMTFRDNVNSAGGDSNRASHLLIFGDGTDYQRQTLRAFGPASVCAAFYGPRTDVTLDGSVHWIGSLNAHSFRVSGGGDGGIHYDESLATVGPIIGFRIARYIEDVRE